MIDKNKLRRETNETAQALKDMKALRNKLFRDCETPEIRKHGLKPGQDYWDWKKAHDFAVTKVRATMLCALTASNRGKKHLTTFPYAAWKTEEEFLKAVNEFGEEHFFVRAA